MRIEKAARRAGANPAEITLVLVSKNVSTPLIEGAYKAGARDFGENRVQELLEKKPCLPGEIQWHFVGHLQTNKVKSVLGEVALLHSLDRISLAEEIQKYSEKKNLTVEVLIQVNTTGEASKSGFAPEEVEGALEKLKPMNRIRIQGLMTLGPLTDNQEAIRGSFRKLWTLRGKLQKKFPDLSLTRLSMGMSSDFEIAVEEGATILRIGTAVFGEKSPQSTVDSPR